MEKEYKKDYYGEITDRAFMAGKIFRGMFEDHVVIHEDEELNEIFEGISMKIGEFHQLAAQKLHDLDN